MSKRVGVVWDERLAEYDFGPGHPLTPIRVQLAMRLAADFDLLVQPNVQLLSPVDPISMDDLLRVHDGQYVAAVVRASETGFEIGVGDRELVLCDHRQDARPGSACPTRRGAPNSSLNCSSACKQREFERKSATLLKSRNVCSKRGVMLNLMMRSQISLTSARIAGLPALHERRSRMAVWLSSSNWTL